MENTTSTNVTLAISSLDSLYYPICKFSEATPSPSYILICLFYIIVWTAVLVVAFYSRGFWQKLREKRNEHGNSGQDTQVPTGN